MKCCINFLTKCQCFEYVNLVLNAGSTIFLTFSTAIAIRGKDGIVFGVEKLVQSKLYEHGANKRIFNVDRHVGMVSITFKNVKILLVNVTTSTFMTNTWLLVQYIMQELTNEYNSITTLT